MSCRERRKAAPIMNRGFFWIASTHQADAFSCHTTKMLFERVNDLSTKRRAWAAIKRFRSQN
jgi:hypothetical protein